MKSYLALATLISALSFTAAPDTSAHCQVPCGIYSDETVLIDLQTHQKTIAKAMDQINTLSKDAGKNAHQITRWITNKEEHASKIQDTMCQYFLAQRLKPSEMSDNKESYLKKLTLAHKIIVLAMKCKQTADTENAKYLEAAIASFTQAYKTK